MTRITSSAGAVALAASGLLAAACDKMPLLAPTNSSVTVTASTAVVAVGGTAEVTAFVAEQSGTPVQNGTVVRFVTNLGRVEPVEAQTKNGLAVTTFFAGDISGIADVRATSGGTGSASSGSGSSTTTNVVQISVGAAAVDSVTLRANPAFVPATGGTVELVAGVLASNGRPLAGIPVTFTNTEGQLSASRVISDASGEAKTNLTTDRTSNITASAGSKTSNQVTVTRRDPAPAPTVTLSATGAVATTVGQSWSFTATVAGTDATSLPTEFQWDFGDGVTAVTNGATTAHVYTVELTPRTVTVRVKLSNGQTITAVTQIITADFP